MSTVNRPQPALRCIIMHYDLIYNIRLYTELKAARASFFFIIIFRNCIYGTFRHCITVETVNNVECYNMYFGKQVLYQQQSSARFRHKIRSLTLNKFWNMCAKMLFKFSHSSFLVFCYITFIKKNVDLIRSSSYGDATLVYLQKNDTYVKVLGLKIFVCLCLYMVKGDHALNVDVVRNWDQLSDHGTESK